MDLTAHDVAAMLAAIDAADQDRAGNPRRLPLYARDRALVLLRAAGISSGTLVSLRREDVLELGGNGCPLRLRAPSRELLVPWAESRQRCPARALWSYVQRCDITSGPLLRTIRGKRNVAAAPMTRDAVRQVLRRYADSALSNGETNRFPVQFERKVS